MAMKPPIDTYLADVATLAARKTGGNRSGRRCDSTASLRRWPRYRHGLAIRLMHPRGGAVHSGKL